MPPTLRGLRGSPRTWVGWLNFLVLQWFGVRLARFYKEETLDLDVMPSATTYLRVGDGPFRVSSSGGVLPAGVDGSQDYYVTRVGEDKLQLGRSVFLHYELLRWLWPLTGWWTDYKWIKWVKP